MSEFLNTIPPYNRRYDIERLEKAWGYLAVACNNLRLGKYEELHKPDKNGLPSRTMFGLTPSHLAWNFVGVADEFTLQRNWAPCGIRYGMDITGDTVSFYTDCRNNPNGSQAFREEQPASALRRWSEIDAFCEGVKLFYLDAPNTHAADL